jgi:hypothetical protein
MVVGALTAVLLFLSDASATAFLTPTASFPKDSTAPRARCTPLLKTVKMSLFPDGSGVTGAVQKKSGTIAVILPRELDNTDPFVLDTMTIRVPKKIIGRTIEYNKDDLSPEASEGMKRFQEEMLNNAKINSLSKGPNVENWNKYLKKYLDKGATWSQLPWYVAETYVYHRLLETSGYWDVDSKGHQHDIFAKEKAEALQQVLPQVAVRMDLCVDAAGEWSAARFRSILHMALWGNQVSSRNFWKSFISFSSSSTDRGAACTRVTVASSQYLR